MKTNKLIPVSLSLVAVLLLLLPQPSVLSQSPGGNAQKLRVLFIGNSYTYVNNLPQMVSGLARSAKEARQMETEMIVVGGATLKRHWEEGRALEALGRGKWDFVVLQEQSTLGPTQPVNGVVPISDPKTFHEYARRFDAEIKKAGAQTVFYLTWARQNQPQDQVTLTSAYLGIANELKATVVPVGIAWENALKKNPKLQLHLPDKSHPTPAGSYLAACVFYAVLYGKSPEGLPGRLVGDKFGLFGPEVSNQGAVQGELVNLSQADAASLQQIAWQTVKK